MKLFTKITVALFLCSIATMVIYCCKKSSPPFPLNYTSKMGGIRPWSGLIIHSYVDTFVTPFIIHVDSAYIMDTFAVVIIDDKNVQMPNIIHDPNQGTTLDLYYQYDSTNSITFFIYGAYNLTYNYQNNTIAYSGQAPADTTFAGEYYIYLHSP